MCKLRIGIGMTGVLLGCAGFSAVAQGKAKTPPAPIHRGPALTPLSPREHVEQLLDRFTYGPRPGEIDRVMAQGGASWLEQQLNPAVIPDPVLTRRLAEYPAIGMSPQQALMVFPDRQQVKAVADGRSSMPADPLERAVMEVQLTKLDDRAEKKQANGEMAPGAKPTAVGGSPTDAVKPTSAAPVAAAGAPGSLRGTGEKQDKADARDTAARLAGVLLGMPKDQRMAAIIAMPVRDRIALTGNGNLPQAERQTLLKDFVPREREAFVAMGSGVNSSGAIGVELAQARVLRDILSERQLETLMTDLWFNHFNVSLDKGPDRWYTASYEREAIRPHALGKFSDLLLATATSPAMMVYLDNLESVGPDSAANGGDRPVGKKGPRGLNENYGREVMELHTVGVNGGYTQADVTALAAILTGWGVEQPQQGGPFAYTPRRHEPGAKAWFGYCIAEDGAVSKLPAHDAASCGAAPAGGGPATQASVQQGVAALKLLAASPHTAHAVAGTLAQYFVADTPPPALVDRLTQTYLATGGDIKAMLRAIVDSPEFNSRQYFRTKVKTPIEFLASAYRSTATDPTNPEAIVNQARVMGMPLYRALPPTGYYLTADQWMNSTALVDRLNFAYLLSGGKVQNQPFDGSHVLAMGLLDSASLPVEEPGQVPVEETGPKREKAMLHTTAVESPGAGTPALPVNAGTQFATQLLGQVVTGGPVSQKTSRLIEAQVTADRAANGQSNGAGASGIRQDGSGKSGTGLDGAGANAASQEMNLIVGLLLGSPEFQRR